MWGRGLVSGGAHTAHGKRHRRDLGHRGVGNAAAAPDGVFVKCVERGFVNSASGGGGGGGGRAERGIPFVVRRLMMRVMVVMLMMKCGKKSSLNFFIFAPLNKVIVVKVWDILNRQHD